MIKGITVTDENNFVIAQLGVATGEDNFFIESTNVDEKGDEQKYFNVSSHNTGLFGHAFPLIFEFSGRTTKVGSVTLLSSNEVIFNRIQVGIYFLIGNAMVKTAALYCYFL